MASTPVVSGIEGTGTTVKKGSAWMAAKTTVTQQTYATDPKYKKYVQQVEKCLNSFDNVHEWADCIAFLKQLLKTFQTYMQFKEIPKKLIVAKRLAQCLNPALPTGVHQRALEVYIHILVVLGGDGLRRDLALWSAGLFPFFEYAATSVKPTLLSIYNTHYLPLQGGLRPIMKSFILALLPGLEEETGEFFDKVIGLLDKLSGSVSISFFFQNIWLVMLTTPAARGTAVNYISRRLPKLNADEDISEIVGKDIGLMIRAFAAALEDDNLLVRRGTLDLLLQAMKLDSLAIRKAQAEDRAIIMRAAIGVVLRRDISLNRRLYSWLLGVEERHDDPLAYYKEHALGLLHLTLKNEMFSPSGEYSESRPFKIFISLLDKWEVGRPLADGIVYDAFRAIKQLMQENRDGGDDLAVTASTLYEALDPEILWKPLLSAIFKDIAEESGKSEAIELALFIIQTFTHDEEIQTCHFPVLIAGLLDFLQLHIESHPEKSTSQPVIQCLTLVEEILQHTSHIGLSERPVIKPPHAAKEQARETSRAYTFARVYYEIDEHAEGTPDTQTTTPIPFASSLNALSVLSIHWATSLAKDSARVVASREAFSRSLTLFERLLLKVAIPLPLAWTAEAWLAHLLQTFDTDAATFTTVDRVVTIATTVHRNEFVQPALKIEERATIHKMVTKLLKYLRPDLVSYHARAVNLICALEVLTKKSHVESIIAQTMTSPESRNVAEAYEAFGILWRLTEDSFLPGFKYKVPMMIVLDALKSQDPNLYRVGETWMRCSLKSYIRLLDPILYDLLDPAILRSSHTFKVQKRELAGFMYERPFDQRLIHHLVETLVSIVGFAGQGFSKAAVSTSIKRSMHPGLIQRVESMGLHDTNRSYMDVLIEILLRFIQSEPKQRLATMQPLNKVLQSSSIQLLQMIVARGDVDQVSVEAMESIVVKKLYYSIHTGNLDLQNKLLHLLHSIISLSMANIENLRRAAARDAQLDSANPYQQDKAVEEIGYPLNPLLVQTLIDGVSVQSNRSIIQHWLDFILMAIPQFQPALQSAIVPLNDCLCRQLKSTLRQVKDITTHTEEYSDDLHTLPTELDLIMLINGLERLVLLGLAFTSEAENADDDNAMQDKQASESTGLLGYVSTVFSSDGSSPAVVDTSATRSLGYRSLDEGVSVLYSIWATLVWKPPAVWTPREESLSQIYMRSRARCRRALEHLFRVQSTEVFESIVDWWSKDLPLQESSPDAAFELIDVLVSTAQNAVHMLCECISNRVGGSSRKAPTNPNLTDTVLFQFLEQYLSRLEGPLAVQVWPRYLQLLKDITTTKEFKPHHYPTLRCLSVLADKITKTTAMDDKRVKKELQDNYAKLLDMCVAFVGRSSDQGSWIRRSTKETLATNGRDSPRPDAKLVDDKTDTSSANFVEPPKGDSGELFGQITTFIAASVLPNLRRFLLENDKVITTCSNIIYYIVNPAMRGKTRPMDVDPIVISIISEMTHVPNTLKSWRTPIIDLLADNRVFNSDPVDGGKWKPVIKALYEADKASFTELLSKVGVAPSANIFTNKEYEMLLRSLNIRRLSYVLFSGDKNTFLAQLPTIQEKLVDALKSTTSPVVQSEVFLCIRILLCRLSPHNLTSFWPVILTEIYRIFEQVMAALPPDGSEDLQLMLAACKTIDLLLVLQTQEFQVYQWIFVTDTIDAIYRPEEWFPEAMLDQLAEIAGSLPMTSQLDVDTAGNGTSHNQPPMRRPLLNSLRQIDSMRELVPFFSNVSITSYESVYASGGNVDWDAVENGLMSDMFDGR